ncbi:UNKNOWN [Stylonychia lemnae]|uniref:Regulator of chromosome condensation n=1 Tax=Stylonychia lemnae TaxID=5949 RepID=A0A078A745_STYLE|nr:UNKNOWN [Stylonychia lemnae]|eukprot:CDW76606.1 UNKNOWN [Stylonychia lemnae]
MLCLGMQVQYLDCNNSLENEFGRLGFDISEDQESFTTFENQIPVIVTPQKCSYNILIRQVACGTLHTHLLSQDGFVYSMGSNQDGRLGLSLPYQELKSQTCPRLVETLHNIRSIAAGGAHSICIDQDYQTYGWGSAENGAIGMRLSSSSSPIKVRFDLANQGRGEIDIIDAHCGLKHSVFLSAKGDVYSCGNCERGQLGLGIMTLKEYNPSKMIFEIKQNDSVRSISCGDYNSAFLTEQGLIYITGDNSMGQLAQGHLNQDFSTRPILIETLVNKKIKKLCLGGKQCSTLSFQGDVYVWGQYNNEIITKPQKLGSSIQPAFREIKASNNLLAAIDAENNLWLWSSNQNNNPLELNQYPDKILELYDVKSSQIYLGNNVVFCLSEDLNQNFETEQDFQQLSEQQQYQAKDNNQNNFYKEDFLKKSRKTKKKLKKSIGKKSKNHVELEPQSFSISKKITDFQRQNSSRGNSQQPNKKISKKLKQIPLNLSQINNKSPISLKKSKSPLYQDKQEKYYTNQTLSNNQPLEARLKLKLKTIMGNQSTQQTQMHQKSFYYNLAGYQPNHQEQNQSDQTCDISRASILDHYSMIKPLQERQLTDDNTCQQNTSCSHEQDLITQINIESDNEDDDNQIINQPLESLQHQTLRPAFIESQVQMSPECKQQQNSNSNKSSCLNIQDKSIGYMNQTESYSARFSVNTREDPEIRLRQKYEIQCLQNENLRISSDLALERKKNETLNQQYYSLIKERQDNYIHKDEFLKIKSQYDELQKHFQDSKLQLAQTLDTNSKLSEQIQLLKTQLMKFNDQISEKEQELGQFVQLADKLQECEDCIDKLQRDKEAREDELLNKMSTLADHYHKEKDKNQKLMSELSRQNEVLQRFEHHVKQAQNEKDYAVSENEKTKNELARLKVDLTINKGKYQSFVSNIRQAQEGEQSFRDYQNDKEQTKQQQEKSPFKLLELPKELQNRYKEQPDQLQSSFYRENHKSENLISSESLINNLYQRRNSQTKSAGVNGYSSRFNENKEIDQEIRIRDTPIQNEQILQDYNNHVLKSLERQAQKSSQERKMNSSFHRQGRYNTQSNISNNQVDYQSFIRDHSPLDSHREMISVLQDTQSTVFLQEVKRDQSRDAFREIGNMNNTITISQIKPNMASESENLFQSEQKKIQHSQISETLSKYCQSKENENQKPQNSFSSNKKAYLKNLVDQELCEIKQLINHPPNIINGSRPNRYFNTNKNENVIKENIKEEEGSEHQLTRSNSDMLETHTTQNQVYQPNHEMDLGNDRQKLENSFIRDNLMKRFSRA